MKKLILLALLLLAAIPLTTARVGQGCAVPSGNVAGDSSTCACAEYCSATASGRQGNFCNPGEAGCICAYRSSGWYQPCQAQLASSWTSWLPLASLAVFVGILFAAVAYMIAYGFDLRELKMWAKAEMFQAFASVILVAGLLALTQTMFDEGFGKILGTNINPYQRSYLYLDRLAVDLQRLWEKNYQDNYYIEAVSTLSIFYNATNLDLNIMAFLKPLLVEPRHVVNHLIMQILILVYFQQTLLSFFQRTMLSILLPWGIFLRVLPPTRGAGGFLIATAIGFFFVFPILFSFIAMMAEEQAQLEEFLQSPAAAAGIDLATFNACKDDIDTAARVGEQQLDPSVLSKVNQFAETLPDITVKAIFFPMVVFAMTLTFIRMLSPILGSDISEVGQGLIKLI